MNEFGEATPLRLRGEGAKRGKKTHRLDPRKKSKQKQLSKGFTNQKRGPERIGEKGTPNS